MPAGDSEIERSLPPSGEKFRDLHKETGEIRGHSHPRRMAEGDDRSEVRMFQRRDSKREDEKSYNRDSSRPGSKSWKDSDASEKSFGREENRRSGSPGYELSKKQKESSEKSDRPWRERESSERRHKEVTHRERDGHPSNSSWHKNKGNQASRDGAYRDRGGDHSWKDREYKDRPDHTPKDRAHRDRGDQSHSNHKDWKSRGHSRDRDHEKGDRVSESKEGLFKSRSVNTGVEATERHPGNTVAERSLGSVSHRSGATFAGGELSSHVHDRESPSLIKHAPSGRSSQGEQLQSDNVSSGVSYSRRNAVGGSSTFHEARVSEKGPEALNATVGGDGRSLPKLKLKVGGITHTLNSDGNKRQAEGSDSVIRTPHQSGTSLKKRSSSAPEPNRRRQRLILQEDSDEEDDIPPSAKEHVQASEEDGFLAYLAEDPGYRRGINYDSNQSLQGVRKSSRIPKKRVFDGDDDGEVEPKRRRKKKVEIDSDEDLYRIEEDEIEHGFAEEEEEIEMANETKLKFSKRRRKSLEADLPSGDDRRVVAGAGKMGVLNDSRTGGVPLTARQRALQSSKEGLADVGASLIEFPEGLTHSASKKQKEVLTAAERQLKKEEAAQKRRQQVEKAAKEIQAVAIQKILCQDSQRKKREGKLQKQREEMEQEKKAAAMAPASNSIRWILGPNGTVVSFSQDVELPKIFSGPLSYPQERERCAGPSCKNAYKYRDSKTLLPLCSLQCYQAVQKKPSDAGLAH
eukprot:c24742_g1_i2 orf=317-2545(+)